MRDIQFNETDCLKPIRHEHSNSVMLGPEGTDILDLHVELVEDGGGQAIVMSTWELSDEQRQRIADGAQVTLVIFQHPMPPVAIALDGPFDPILGTGEAEAEHEDDRGPAPDPNEAAVRAAFHPERPADDGAPESL